jgi:hypothetical protein
VPELPKEVLDDELISACIYDNPKPVIEQAPALLRTIPE